MKIKINGKPVEITSADLEGYKIDTRKLMLNNEAPEKSGFTHHGLHFKIFREGELDVVISRYMFMYTLNYRGLFVVDGLSFYGDRENREKILEALIEKEIIYVPRSGEE